MEYAESLEQAAKYAEKALEEIRARGLTQHPNNYTLWYMYAAAAMPDLTSAITGFDAKQEPVTEQHCSELYERYFSTAREESAVEEVSSKLSSQVTTVLGDITTAGEDAGAHISDLGTVLENLSEDGGSAKAKTAISSAIEITRDISEKNSVLEINLRQSSAEIERLRSDLEILRQEAYTDGLTGIANRKRFDQELKNSTINAMNESTPLCLMMIDIDFFKAFNDTHGHQVGDLVLRLLAGTLRDKKSGNDMGRITISIGVTTFKYGESVGQFIYRADQAMYHAKNSGRDKVCSDSDVDTAVAHYEI